MYSEDSIGAGCGWDALGDGTVGDEDVKGVWGCLGDAGDPEGGCEGVD